jgi:hypothetical protein
MNIGDIHNVWRRMRGLPPIVKGGTLITWTLSYGGQVLNYYMVPLEEPFLANYESTPIIFKTPAGRTLVLKGAMVKATLEPYEEGDLLW